MTDNTDTNATAKTGEAQKTGETQTAANGNDPATVPDTGQGRPETAPAGEADPFAVLEKLNAENADLKDRMLRTLAEMENLRRRTEKEVGDAKLYGVANMARDMLVFADNLRRAIDSLPEELRNAEGAAKAFVEGIEVTERDFQSRLNRHGVRRLEPKGQKFDPNMHEALFEVPDPSVPNGTVVQVVEDGYSIGERCLRPAKVGVARGGSKEAPAANGQS
ncbi:MAG: nucleotide exchange factor GrpE [Beijerinckiaceae bacterium]